MKMKYDKKELEKAITRAASKNELVLFVGSGISQVVGGPSWSKLAGKYLEFIFEKGKKTNLLGYSDYIHLQSFDSRKLLSICDKLSKKVSPEKFNFKKCLEEEVKKPPNHEEFWDIFSFIEDFKCPIITTNYDSFLDCQDRMTKEIIFHPNALPSKVSELKKNSVAHIHGSVHKDDDLVLTLGDYFEAYGASSNSKSKLPDFLRDLFNEKVVLFIGYGLEEYEVLEYVFIRNSKFRSGKKEHKHYMLYPVLNDRDKAVDALVEYYLQLNIKLVTYSISQNGYEQLFYELKDLSKNIYSSQNNIIENLKFIDGFI